MPNDNSGGQDEYGLPTPDLSVFGDEQSPTERQSRPDTGEPGRDDAAESGPAAEPQAAEHDGEPTPESPTRPRGRMTFQDEHTAKHQPTLAEQRARQQPDAEQAAEAERQAEDAARRARTKRRLLIGGAVVVVAAGIIGSQYLFNSTTTANCVDADSGVQGAVVNDQYCDQAYVQSHGGYVHNGIIFLPIGNGSFRQYQYYYGGTVSNGHVSGGSYTAPSNGSIKTGSGKTISRGGFGVSSDSGSSGSRSGSSGGKSGGS